MMNINAARRTADTLLRVMGGGTVMLRITIQPAQGDAAQVGIGGSLYQDEAMTPALLRRVAPAMQSDGPTQYEVLVSACAVDALVQSAGVASAQALFQTASGVVIDGQVKAITSAGTSEAFGGAYMYTLKLRDY